MELFEFLKQLLILAIGGCAALIFAFYLVWPKIESHLFRVNNIHQHKATTHEQLQIRFAAYERLLLLVHRISPEQVMLRHYESARTALQLKQLMIADIDQEFQHNFTQQLYVSDVAWNAVHNVKKSTVALLQNAARGLDDQAGKDDYTAIVLRHVAELEANPYEAVQAILKKELSA